MENAFEKSLSDTLDDFTMSLPVEDQRVYGPTDIIYRRVAYDLGLARLSIDLDLANGRTIWKRVT